MTSTFLNYNQLSSKFALVKLTFLFLKMAQSTSTISTCPVSGATKTEHPYLVTYVTIDNDTNAETLASSLVENNLAACVNIVPKIRSIYKWEGKLSKDNEILLIIKTKTSVVDKMTKFIQKNHPYTNCEVISIPIVNGSSKYLKWIEDSVH